MTVWDQTTGIPTPRSMCVVGAHWSWSCSCWCRAGHFNYQDSFEKELSASAPVAELEAEALELYNISEEWKKTVAQMRRAYYFLNFFNMRQILLLVKYLDRFQAKAEEDGV